MDAISMDVAPLRSKMDTILVEREQQLPSITVNLSIKTGNN